MTSPAPIAKRIELFESVRDQEYRFNLLDPAEDRSCFGKAGRLIALFRAAGLEARHRCCDFRWADTVPPKIAAPMMLDTSRHHFVEVLVPETNKWTKVDPTWDIKLKGAGFPVATWDGVRDTILAVTPLRHHTPEKSEKIYGKWAARSDEERRTFCNEMGSAYDGLNSWIASQRQARTDLHA